MGCSLQPSNFPIFCRFIAEKPMVRVRTHTFSTSGRHNQQEPALATAATEMQLVNPDVYSVKFETLEDCRLGVSRYPDFQYNGTRGGGTGIAKKTENNDLNDEISVRFNLETLFIPPLTSTTTRFLGLPLPPFLRIDIVPELFEGSIDRKSGKVNLEFKAKFCFSVGSIYRAQPLQVATVLTSEESNGAMRNGRGEKLNKAGKCRLVGVATVEPVDDFLLTTFLGLPTECLANLNAVITISNS